MAVARQLAVWANERKFPVAIGDSIDDERALAGDLSCLLRTCSCRCSLGEEIPPCFGYLQGRLLLGEAVEGAEAPD